MRSRITLFLVLIVVVASLATTEGSLYDTAPGRLQDPPRGWDSYDFYPVWDKLSMNESETLRQAAAIARFNTTGRFQFLVIDEGWAEQEFGWTLDMHGRPMPNPLQFPSTASTGGFRPLRDKLLNEFGLDLGLWMIKGIPKQAVTMNLSIAAASSSVNHYTATEAYAPNRVCDWHPDVYDVNVTNNNPAGLAYYRSLAKKYFQEWGIRYIKIDCIFGANLVPNELEAFTNYIVQESGGTTFISLSPGANATPSMANEYGRLANIYRVTNDLWDCWAPNKTRCPTGTSVLTTTDALVRVWQPLMNKTKRYDSYVPTHPDPDMLALGNIRLGGGVNRASRFTHGMSRYVYLMWSITRSPIILGGDMTNLTPNLESLFSNVLLTEMHQDSKNPSVAMYDAIPSSSSQGEGLVVWYSEHKYIAGARWVAVFPFSTDIHATHSRSVSISMSEIGVGLGNATGYGAMAVTDVLTQGKLPSISLMNGAAAAVLNATVPVNDAAAFLLIGAKW